MRDNERLEPRCAQKCEDERQQEDASTRASERASRDHGVVIREDVFHDIRVLVVELTFPVASFTFPQFLTSVLLMWLM